MPNTNIKVTPRRILELDLAATLLGPEQVAIVQTNETRRVVLDTLKDFFDDSCQCTLVSRSNQVCTDANTLETFLQTYTLPGGTLANDGEWLDIYISGLFAENVNNKTLTFYFGGTSVTTGLFANNATTRWFIEVRLQRSTGFLQKMGTKFQYNDDTDPMTTAWGGGASIDSPTETMSADIEISISGTNGTASANDICVEQFIIVHHKVEVNS